jgi:hypothetical protein
MIATSNSTALVVHDGPWLDADPVVDAHDWARFAPTAPAEACLVRFAAREADVSHAGLTGLGRQSPARFPRLGGVLHGRIAPGTVAATAVAAATEQTIRAGYQAALATHQVAAEPVEHADAEELWQAFVPASYRIPRRVASTAWALCRFEDLWVALLTDVGLDGDANRFGNGQVSPLSRSIRGLSTVGVALALTERGGRYERQRAGRRPLFARRPERRERRDLPPAPRRPADAS